jgi:hypothetical protein
LGFDLQLVPTAVALPADRRLATRRKGRCRRLPQMGCLRDQRRRNGHRGACRLHHHYCHAGAEGSQRDLKPSHSPATAPARASLRPIAPPSAVVKRQAIRTASRRRGSSRRVQPAHRTGQSASDRSRYNKPGERAEPRSVRSRPGTPVAPRDDRWLRPSRYSPNCLVMRPATSIG